MPKREQSQIPTYLKPLVHPTPSGVAKLLAAWDGLSAETQMQLLEYVEHSGLSKYLAQKVRVKALENRNPYVRYLAAIGFSFSDNDPEDMKAIRRRIEEDPDPLVRYSPLETSLRIGDRYLLDQDEFWALPQAARLALFRRLPRWGLSIVRLVSHALQNQLRVGLVTERELYEILYDFVSREEFKKQFCDTCPKYDFRSQHDEEEAFNAWWRLVKELPEDIAKPLVEHLPAEGGTHLEIPRDVLDNLSDHQLETLLSRPEVRLYQFRKRMFFDAGSDRDMVRSAAAFFNFNLEREEFARILSKPEPEKSSLLSALTFAEDLGLSLLDAVHDALFESDSWEQAEFARRGLNRRLSRLRGRKREAELLELQLYRLAKRYVPWRRDKAGHEPAGEWEFLRPAIVHGDTWRTFMGFIERWVFVDKAASESLSQNLPGIPEVDGEYAEG